MAFGEGVGKELAADKGAGPGTWGYIYIYIYIERERDTYINTLFDCCCFIS